MTDAVPPPSFPPPEGEKPPSILPADVLDGLRSLIPTNERQLRILEASEKERTRRANEDYRRKRNLTVLAIVLLVLEIVRILLAAGHP